MLTKQHLEAIARIIKDTSHKPDNHIDRDLFLLDLMTYLESQNPNFSRPRFLKACGEYEES